MIEITPEIAIAENELEFRLATPPDRGARMSIKWKPLFNSGLM